MGLSPHRRGNPCTTRSARCWPGSIPAQAGEPHSWRRSPGAPQVYPRTGGGTVKSTGTGFAVAGLSPHRRGNRIRASKLQKCTRSIPAQAGEPMNYCRRARKIWVYPRTGGGTIYIRDHATTRKGLSPHRRGNPIQNPIPKPALRSIPAQAGEPNPRIETTEMYEVYPRTGGGTHELLSPRPQNLGLSPHRRGNHIHT